jgi:hypothetical protein
MLANGLFIMKAYVQIFRIRELNLIFIRGEKIRDIVYYLVKLCAVRLFLLITNL